MSQNFHDKGFILKFAEFTFFNNSIIDKDQTAKI